MGKPFQIERHLLKIDITAEKFRTADNVMI